MRRSTYVKFNKTGFFILWFFCDLLWFFKDLVKIKNKIKIEKPLPPHSKTAQGGYINGFVSLRRLNGRFCGPEKKSKFCSKLRELKMTFSFLIFFLGLTNGPAIVSFHFIWHGSFGNNTIKLSTETNLTVHSLGFYTNSNRVSTNYI